MILEIAVSNLEAAILAANAGAHRIELCDNLVEGGTTPSIGMVQNALQNISIPTYPIIRPRGGHFVYSAAEFASMLYDVQAFASMGCKGIVIGILNPNGTIDVARNTQLIKAANGMQVTFHRAFDRVVNATDALQTIIDIGCTRILTSGLQPNVVAGASTIANLVQQAGNQIIIMPGSGVRSSNLAKLITTTRATEYHSSAAMPNPPHTNYHNPNMASTDGNYTTVNAAEIKAQLSIIVTA